MGTQGAATLTIGTDRTEGADRLPRGIHTGIATTPGRRQRGYGPLDVTFREAEVLQLVADGLGNREIARALYVSEQTVKTHIHRLLRKLDAGGRAHAVAIGIRTGIIE